MLREFVESLGEGGDLIRALRSGLIGGDAIIEGPDGPKRMLYADYAASGRALIQVERFISERILPFYSNSHTEASYCGAFMNRLRSEARTAVAEICNAGPDYSVIFTGSGATSGINQLVRLFLIEQESHSSGELVVLHGPYEHHSNILPWRECGATIVDIPEGAEGGPDLAALEAALVDAGPNRRVIGAFSAASNVTGIITDVDRVTRVLKRYGAFAFWDYAGGGPYLPVLMNSAGASKDAVVISPHKFVGGPAASGLLILRKNAIAASRPSAPGGGTVSFVSPWEHIYIDDLGAREEAGTSNIIGDIRAAIVMLIKAAVGEQTIAERGEAFSLRALNAWRSNARIELLGRQDITKLPIHSFRVRNADGGHVHHQLFTRMLSDYYGVQARGGCACAGPYAHELLNISAEESRALSAQIVAGNELAKPGWVRLNFSYLLDDESADRLICAVDELAQRAAGLQSAYSCDPATARFALRDAEAGRLPS